jgi:hypothetical protein
MDKEWKKRHRYFRQWAKSERKDIDTSDNGQRVKEKTFTLCRLSEVSMSFRSLFAHCLEYLCLFFHSLPIVWSIYVFSFTLCPLSEVSMSFLSLFVHCLKYLCLFFHSLPIVWSIYVFSFTFCPLSEVSMSFLSLFVHCLKYLCLFCYSLPIVWSIYVFFHSLSIVCSIYVFSFTLCPLSVAKSERKDIDTSDNGQRVKEKT